MTIAESLREAIQSQRWDLVVEVYTSLTGNKIDVPANGFNVEELKSEIDTIFRRHANSVVKTSAVITMKDVLKEGESTEEEVSRQIQTAAKKNIYNEKPAELITDKVIETELQQNLEKAEKRSKTPRPEPKKYKTKCTDCDIEFEIPFKLTGDDIGMCCAKCVKGKRKEVKE